jgi:ATP-dependent DNA helicase RecG
MADAVPLTERVLTSIQLGESHFREFKSALEGPSNTKRQRDKREIAKDICSTLVAFANADGGELIVGVEDNGDITGFLISDDELVHYLLSCYKDGVHKRTPLANVRAVRLSLERKDVLYFSTQKSTTTLHQTADGRCLQRRDLETVPISVEEIQFTRGERISREYDREFIDGPQADVLDLSMVRALADQVSRGMSVEKCLQYLDLADFSQGGLKLRRAAFLLFAKEPSNWHPRLQIRILKVTGTEVKTGHEYNIKDEYIYGNVISLIEKAWDRLRPHLVQTRLSGAGRFESRVMYPELACREALINAIAHRDYSQEGRGVEIYVFDDRMEVKSPGALLSSLSIEDLKRLEGAHQSRNSLVARVLREMGYMREVGEGMRRMFELMQSNELAAPEIVSTPEAFTVALRNRPIYKPEHQLWLEEFAPLSLNREQKGIIVLGYGNRLISPNDIWNSLGLQDTEHYRQLISSLQKLNVLVTEVPKPLAQRQARSKRLNVRDVPRFRIQVPTRHATAAERVRGVRGKTALRASAVVEKSRIRPSELDHFESAARVFLANIPATADRAGLLAFLSAQGFPGDVYLPTQSGWSKGYAFVQLDTEQTAKDAIEELNGREFQGHRLVARRAFPRMNS